MNHSNFLISELFIKVINRSHICLFTIYFCVDCCVPNTQGIFKLIYVHYVGRTSYSIHNTTSSGFTRDECRLTFVAFALGETRFASPVGTGTQSRGNLLPDFYYYWATVYLIRILWTSLIIPTVNLEELTFIACECFLVMLESSEQYKTSLSYSSIG